MKLTPSTEHFHVSGREASARRAAGASLVAMEAADAATVSLNELRMAGLGLDEADVQAIVAFAMDDPQGGVLSPSIGVPVQFLQAWLPGLVRAVFKVRVIDELVGITTIGQWHDEEIVQGAVESMGDAVPYGDFTNIPFATWNLNFERRTVVRFEKGFAVGRLEEARAGAIRVSSTAEKRVGASTALDIQRNQVGFVGYNAGADRTYGLLNDPNLPAYITVANGATSGSPLWSGKSTLDIIADLIAAFQALEVQSGGNIQPKVDETTLVLPTGWDAYLGTPTTLGYSAAAWLKATYPKCRVLTAPQFQAANGGANVGYLYADRVESDPESTDDGRTFLQAVPARMQTLGAWQIDKRFVEDFTNATAGVMCKRPWAIYRFSGI